MSINLDRSLSTKAVHALYKHEIKQRESQPNKLLGDFVKPILAQIELVKEKSKAVLRPVRVKIPHSLFSSEEDHSICFFCRTEDKSAIISHLQASSIPGLGEDSVKSLDDVKKFYHAFKDKKKLLHEYTHFLCDANIMNHLYNLLGKTFGDRNNYPIPIMFASMDKLEESITKAINSTYMYLKGKNLTIRFGHTGMSPTDITENIMEGLIFAIDKLGGKNTVRSIHLKTSDSPALPIYSAVPSDVITYVKALSTATKTEDGTVQLNIETSRRKRKAANAALREAEKLEVVTTNGDKDKKTPAVTSAQVTSQKSTDELIQTKPVKKVKVNDSVEEKQLTKGSKNSKGKGKVNPSPSPSKTSELIPIRSKDKKSGLKSQSKLRTTNKLRKGKA